MGHYRAVKGVKAEPLPPPPKMTQRHISANRSGKDSLWPRQMKARRRRVEVGVGRWGGGLSLSHLFDNGRGCRGSRQGREAGPRERQQAGRFCVVGWSVPRPPPPPPPKKQTKNNNTPATSRTRACRRQLSHRRRQAAARYIIRRHSSVSQIRAPGCRELDYGTRAEKSKRQTSRTQSVFFFFS